MIKFRDPNISLLFLILFHIVACTQVDEKNFLFEAELTADYRFPLHNFMQQPELHIYNDYLILSTTFNPYNQTDYFYQAYKLSDFTFVGAFGPRGRGPGEWINPQVVRPSSNSPYLYLYEGSRQSTTIIHKMTLDSIPKLKTDSSELTIHPFFLSIELKT